MPDHPRPQVSLFAPAKVNLYLHVTGKREDGYHLLDSLVAFSTVGDALRVEESERFSFHVDGPFALSLSDKERENSADSSNIAVRAAVAVAEAAGRKPDISIHLTKNLPPAAGIGGGSADAAAVVRGLLGLWDLPFDAAFVDRLLRGLGADVPVCFYGRAARIGGIGEILTAVPSLPPLPAVLVNPLKACPTPQVFQSTRLSVRPSAPLPEKFEDTFSLTEFLKKTRNDLTEAAVSLVPDIAACLKALGDTDGCLLGRMSGSGATCFGIFATEKDAVRAAQNIRSAYPGWWVRAGAIGNG